MPFVYIVMGEPRYEEGYRPIRAFAKESDADDFITTCGAYDQTAPLEPIGSHHAEWEAYHVLLHLWKRAHPAGSHTYYSLMYSTEVEFVP